MVFPSRQPVPCPARAAAAVTPLAGQVATLGIHLEIDKAQLATLTRVASRESRADSATCVQRVSECQPQAVHAAHNSGKSFELREWGEKGMGSERGHEVVARKVSEN